MNETIDDRLKRLNVEFDKLLARSFCAVDENLDMLLRFGLSPEEAQAWLSKEPNYDSRRKVTPSETDEEEPVPFQPLYKGGIVCAEHISTQLSKIPKIG